MTTYLKSVELKNVISYNAITREKGSEASAG
jgi:hypothetical protein